MDHLQLQVKNQKELTVQQYSALELHNRIRAAGELAAANYVEFCKNLKEMRDRELYSELGFKSFDAYTADALSMRQRQAYYYISQYERLGDNFLNANAKLGVTKLSLLASISSEEREELMQEGDINEISAAELKRALEKLKATEERLEERNSEIKELKERLEQDDDTDDEDDEDNEDSYELERLREENERLTKQSEANTSKSDLDKLVAEAVEKQRKALENEAQKAAEMNAADKIEQARNKAKQDAAAEIKKARDEAETAKAELSKLETIQFDLKEEQERRERIEKELVRSANPHLTKFKFMAEQAQAGLNAMISQLGAMDAETKEKCAAVITKLAEGVLKAVAA